MTIPKGFIWEGVKSDALDVICEGIENRLGNSFTFFEWREKGGYHVTGSTKKEFLISCSSKEYGAMLAREVSILLDQALEHRMILANAYQKKDFPSHSWLLVTTYYWCLFLALAWLRMIGSVVTFLPTSEIDRLKKLGKKEHKAPGNGTFQISMIDVYGAKSSLQLRKLGSNNFHDGLWQTFFLDIQERLNLAKDEPANMETRIFSALNFQNRFDKTSWLSKLRNAVNYRVGFAYGCVDAKRIPDLFDSLESVKALSIDALLHQVESTQTKTGGRPVYERPNEYANSMLLFGVLISRLIEDYYGEILALRGINPTWHERRNSYIARLSGEIGPIWPL
ncbi:hypothetical protein H8L32_04670 [Undibacterium sp. CY18W]|uniref:ApeA N-terminal domain-containing protein n=1 Tax=Undibacterium hunanense TaxID=2762292 RepID=A0ABR6ZLI5_9BURK|nr:hypothetical protein [Undibacterium hunanense]MBC3916759.1 hypothetical protein [Undibacterium hunanense]